MKLQFYVQDQKIYASEGDVQAEYGQGAFTVSDADDPNSYVAVRFVYLMRPGQYAKCEIADDTETIRIND